MKRFLKTDVFEGRKWLAPVVALTLVFFVTCFLLFLALAALSGILFYRNGLAPHLNATLDRDVANYQEYREGKPIFPESFASFDVNDYFYLDAMEKYIGENSCNLYLDITYTSEEYAAELARLNDYSSKQYVPVYDDKGKEIHVYDTDGKEIQQFITGYFLFDENCEYFKYPTYISEYNHREGHYEYAMLAGENRIVYVYLSLMRDEDLRISRHYCPTHYDTATMVNSLEVCYSVHDGEQINNYCKSKLNGKTGNDVWKIEGFGNGKAYPEIKDTPLH